MSVHHVGFDRLFGTRKSTVFVGASMRSRLMPIRNLRWGWLRVDGLRLGGGLEICLSVMRGVKVGVHGENVCAIIPFWDLVYKLHVHGY